MMRLKITFSRLYQNDTHALAKVDGEPFNIGYAYIIREFSLCV